MEPLLKHYFDVLALKPTTDKNLIREAFERKAYGILFPNSRLCNTNESRTKALNEAFIAIKTAQEAFLQNAFSLQDIQVPDAAVPDDGTTTGIDKLRRELGSLKAHQILEQTAIVAKQEGKQSVDIYGSQILALQDLCSKQQARITHVTNVANQNHENLQSKTVLHENLERRYSVLEREHCELESENVVLCLELARWKANYRELSFVISDLEDIE